MNLFLNSYVSTSGDECSRVGVLISTHFQTVGPMKPFDKAEGRNSQCQWQHWINMDSAGGGMKEARSNEFQAVLPVRGKILNCQKAALDKMMANAEVRDMIKAFGLDLDVKTGKVSYDASKLRYSKIIISADADVSETAYERLFA